MLKNTPNQADNIAIFQSCLLPKMRLSVALEGRYIGYMSITLLLAPQIFGRCARRLCNVYALAGRFIGW